MRRAYTSCIVVLFSICTLVSAIYNKCGENLTWWVGQDGTLTISGSGEMTNFTFEGGAPWSKLAKVYGFPSIKLVIEEGVTTVGDFAFSGCDGILEASLPRSVKWIGDRAFFECRGLNEITVEKENAFFSVVDGVLFNHDQTTLVKYPSRLSDSYTIPSTVKTIGNSAFDFWFGQTLVIPDSVTSIGDYAFYEAHTYSLTIPDSVTTIGKYAFSLAGGLYCSMIRRGTKSIGMGAFAGCRVSSFTVEEGNEFYTSVDGVLFNYDQTVLVQYPAARSDKYFVVPEGVKTIGAGAFRGCSKLITISIPDSVTTIEDGAFYGCTSLSEGVFGSKLTTIGDEAFYGCSSLIDVVIPESVTTIGNKAFSSCEGLINAMIKKVSCGGICATAQKRSL